MYYRLRLVHSAMFESNGLQHIDIDRNGKLSEELYERLHYSRPRPGFLSLHGSSDDKY